MAFFRYRYVDVGTVFTGDARHRSTRERDTSPAILYSNELACDVGGTCWGPNQPLAILDHHPRQLAQFPSAAAAVLHKAALIRDRFARADHLVWLVTHKQPDFDAFCSTYLARWLITDPAATADWTRYGLHPDGWLDLPDAPKVDWFNPDLSLVPAEHRWPLLLASYASLVEMRRPIACPPERNLRSVLHAAVKRGRDYLNVENGATEFFDEVRTSLQAKQLSPAFDSVLQDNAQFAPELAFLVREIESYHRDLARARTAIVYLPEAEAPTPDFFLHPKKPAEASVEHRLLADTFRIPTDGIYLRDPECALFTEWARVDVQRSSLGYGFEFTATAQSNLRPAASGNGTGYVFSIDPDRAEGRHLFTVWSRLQTEEVEAHRARLESGPDALYDQKAGEVDALLSDPWSGGQSQSSTLVETPRRGTLIGPSGVQRDLRDDPVAQAVRAELENVIFAAKSLLAGPQVAVFDLAAGDGAEDLEACLFELNSPANIPAPEPGYFRFASLRLRPDVPIASGHVLVRQIAEVLWQVLHPDLSGVPVEELVQHAIIMQDSVGLWSERGIAVARKLPGTDTPEADANFAVFADVVALARGVDRLAEEWKKAELPAYLRAQGRSSRAAQSLAADGEELARQALELQQKLTLPEHELVHKFWNVMGMDKILLALRDFTQNMTEILRQEVAMEEARRQERRAEDVGRVQQKMKWLQVALVGFIALQLAGTVLRNVSLAPVTRQMIALFTGPVAAALAAWLLPSPKLTRGVRHKSTGFRWVLLSALIVFVMFWVAQLLRTW